MTEHIAENDKWKDWYDSLSLRAQKEAGQDVAASVFQPDFAQWAVVVVFPYEQPLFERFDSLDDLVDFLKDLEDDVYYFPFFGIPVQHGYYANMPQRKFIRLPSGETIDLFDQEQVVVNTDGYSPSFGPISMIDPALIPRSPQSRITPLEDFEDDDYDLNNQ